MLYQIGAQPLSEIPSLAAWRAAFRLFGVDPTKYRSAAEALLRRLTKKGDIPSISALVDLCNLVSIRYALPVAAFDARALSGALTVRFAAGDEAFTAHDSPEPEHPEPGEVIFADPARSGGRPALVLETEPRKHRRAGHAQRYPDRRSAAPRWAAGDPGSLERSIDSARAVCGWQLQFGCFG